MKLIITCAIFTVITLVFTGCKKESAHYLTNHVPGIYLVRGNYTFSTVPINSQPDTSYAIGPDTLYVAKESDNSLSVAYRGYNIDGVTYQNGTVFSSYDAPPAITLTFSLGNPIGLSAYLGDGTNSSYIYVVNGQKIE